MCRIVKHMKHKANKYISKCILFQPNSQTISDYTKYGSCGMGNNSLLIKRFVLRNNEHV